MCVICLLLLEFTHKVTSSLRVPENKARGDFKLDDSPANYGKLFTTKNLTMRFMLFWNGFLDVIPEFPLFQFLTSVLFKNEEKKTAQFLVASWWSITGLTPDSTTLIRSPLSNSSINAGIMVCFNFYKKNYHSF